MNLSSFLRCGLALALSVPAFAQTVQTPWHGKNRAVRYTPQGTDFVCVNGPYRFNRALYGGNSGFRVEAGDLPEFAMYMPGMGGNFKLGLVSGGSSKWITKAATIKAIYSPGKMLYEISDPALGKGVLKLEVLATVAKEGLILKANFSGLAAPVDLCMAYGGATGTKFSRDGDIGADPESVFYLQPGYCKTNSYRIDGNRFRLSYGAGTVQSEAERYEIRENQSAPIAPERQPQKQISGIFPAGSVLKTSDALKLENPATLLASVPADAPVITASKSVSNGTYYFLIQAGAPEMLPANDALPAIFANADASREAVVGRCVITTPDPFINTMGGAIAIAADAVWESPSYLHGAVAWRMRLNGWRGAYVADPLGWHDRAEEHFNAYSKSQVILPLSGPVVPDTALRFARQAEKMGTSVFSSGYISRNPNNNTVPHHYDMNLVFIDQVLNHFDYVGDTSYVRKMWPMLVRHLAWEKRNFDKDGDGLYDAYAAIWASDGLQYSGGGVTHSSAYVYKANRSAAFLASLIGEDPMPYRAEADKILAAIQKNLWLKDKGWYAEYKDLLGLQLVHPAAALWTVYHAIDSKVPDKFQAYQTLSYVDREIPHIPIIAKGLPDGFYLLSTSNWQPYTWSINNVVLAENLHTALAYWQGNRPDEAFRLWKGAMVESMYLGKSPANIQQISFYDAIRGELYRDFADDVGMAVRSVSEGLFGITPDALNGRLIVKPGFPSDWNYAGYKVPDITFDFKRTGSTDNYRIVQNFPKKLRIDLQLRAVRDRVASVKVNGKIVKFTPLDDPGKRPLISIECGNSKELRVEVTWSGLPIVDFSEAPISATNLRKLVRSDIYDPAGLGEIASFTKKQGVRFIKTKQGQFTWWVPEHRNDKEPEKEEASVTTTGTFEKIDLSGWFNDKVTSIFKNNYLSPRPSSPTLQLPIQGIGNWCYPLTEAVIDDSGLRALAGEKNEIRLPQGVPFATPNSKGANNILFTSRWDNYPAEKTIPVSGKARQIDFLVAGSTNPMQSRMTNAELVVTYSDGTTRTLALKNPENWWPIEQDYLEDGYAFTAGKSPRLRVHLKTGLITDNFRNYSGIKGFSNRGIDGGAATVVCLELDPARELKSLTLRTLTNDVVVGLMAATLVK